MREWPKAWASFRLAKEIWTDEINGINARTTHEKSMLFPIGQPTYKDDMAEILQAMIDADVLVLASFVYFYFINTQLKVVIYRTVTRWLEVKNKEFYYIMTKTYEMGKNI